MFSQLLEMFNSKADKKAQIGIGALPDTMVTIGIVGVVAVVMLIVIIELGANETVADDADVEEIINATKDTIKAPFDLLPLFGTILILLVILALVFVIYKLRQGSAQ